MDSTPIADIMQDAPGMMDAQDPRAQFMNTSNYMPQTPMMAAAAPSQAKAKKDSGEYRDSYFLALEAIKAILEAYQDCQENGFLDSFADTTALEDAIEAARELL